MSGSGPLLTPRRALPTLVALLACLASPPEGLGAAPPGRIALDSQRFKELVWRPIGPANMGGRVSDLAVVEKRPATFYVALGTGGVFKTSNLGTTWSAVFEKEAVASIGAVAVWQKNPDVVWVGTGEANSRNSSSWGNGVYRSLDAGATWKHLGLEATHTIARVVTDPGDSNTVWVAALGRLWGESPERGVYVTRDGGRTWAQSLKVDPRTGACDLAIDPGNPRVLYAAMHARRRTPWSFTSGGATGGIFKTTDGGRTWKKLTQGLPAETGRIGLDVYRKDPRVIVAVIESGEGGQIATFESKSRAGGVFRSDDGGEHWARLGPWSPRPFYFSQIRVQPDDDRRVYLLGVDLWVSDDAGRSFRAGGGKNLHPDFHAMWIDPANGDHVLTGTDGGVFLSHDRAASWDYLNNLAAGEFYNLAVDLREPYRVYGGLQDNQTWGGPVRTRFNSDSWLDPSRHDGIWNGDWYCLGGGDGFHVAVDPTDPDIVYYESQGGWLQRVNLATGKERFLRPAAREGSPEYRFNWNTPFALSPHDPSVLWMGGNHLFRLYERGDRWEEASPDLTTRDPRKMVAAGSGAETHCTIVTLAESPLTKGLVWVGTDDGKLWLTRDAGVHWSDRTANLRGVPAGLYLSRIEASHHDPGTAYLAVDGHRSDVFRPFLFVTRDFGSSWTSIVGNLPPDGPVKVVRESPGSRDLLFAGTEFGLFLSLDRGAQWVKAGEGLPTVAVDDILVHPRERDLIAGTHGRSLYVLDDITALEQWTKATGEAPVTLFAPRPATAFHYRTLSGLWGQAMFTAQNPAFGAYFNYYVKEWTGEGVSLTVTDSAGTTLRKLTGPGSPGFHRVVWDLQREPRERLARPEWGDQADFVPPGTYTVKLTYGKVPEQKRNLVVRHAPGTADPAP
ncbi:MAG: VPS10 domain-containing protein [Candidatus Eiseniibacteriota bacterium]